MGHKLAYVPNTSSASEPVSDNMDLNELSSDEQKWDFIRGVFETSGAINYDPASNDVIMSMKLFSRATGPDPAEEFHGIFSVVPIVKWTTDTDGHALARIEGSDVLGVIESMYREPHLITKRQDVRQLYALCCAQARPEIKVVRHDPAAVLPKKTIHSDAGYDLTLIKLSSVKGMVRMYDTGVSVCPPPGYYLDMVPRSSIIKTGYMLANNVGIIDPAYRGTIKVALIKVDPDAPELELPQRLVQLIPRRTHYVDVCEQDAWETTTVRAEGGFGSTGKN